MKVVGAILALWAGTITPHHHAALAFVPIIPCQSKSRTHATTTTEIRAFPLFNWFFQKGDSDVADEATANSKEAEAMHQTAKMMEDHRRSQEAAERTAAIMDELSSATVVGRSKAGAGGGLALGGEGRRGGVKVTFNGHQKPIAAEVDPNFLFSSSSMSEFQGGVISIDELNVAITDAMEDGYAQSGRLVEEKIKNLYDQLSLPREAPSLPLDKDEK